MPVVGRRTLLAAGASLVAALRLAGTGALAASAGPRLGAPAPFDFDRLKRTAKALAGGAHVPAVSAAPEALQAIDFDMVQKIRFRRARALWADDGTPFPVAFFHLNRYADLPVNIHVVSGGTAREVLYAPEYFDYGATGLGPRLPGDLGFSGFRVLNRRPGETDWLAFQGASYFRSSGALDQYGASARGIAVDTGLDKPEEFPRFSAFWLEGAPADADRVTIYALLEGPSLTGAYRIVAAKQEGVTTEVHADLFPRKAIRRLGIAPLTSMFWYGENNRHIAKDWRPEIHDSDGLALWTGAGARIWRPLINPPAVQTSVFRDRSPRGFGLMQRDRVFDHYQDDSVFYDRRPSLWVEPLEDWGPGAVHLLEIPTDDEIYDNIAAYWQSDREVVGGESLSLGYRLHWVAAHPRPPGGVARVVATRIGHGGVPGAKRPPDHKKFVVDFEGGPLDDLERRYDIEPVVTLSRGRTENPYVVQVVGTRSWRAVFDIDIPGKEPVEMRCFLRLGDKVLTETWLYQYHPFAF